MDLKIVIGIVVAAIIVAGAAARNAFPTHKTVVNVMELFFGLTPMQREEVKRALDARFAITDKKERQNFKVPANINWHLLPAFWWTWHALQREHPRAFWVGFFAAVTQVPFQLVWLIAHFTR